MLHRQSKRWQKTKFITFSSHLILRRVISAEFSSALTPSRDSSRNILFSKINICKRGLTKKPTRTFQVLNLLARLFYPQPQTQLSPPPCNSTLFSNKFLLPILVPEIKSLFCCLVNPNRLFIQHRLLSLLKIVFQSNDQF